MNATAPAFNPTNAPAMNTAVKPWTPGAQAAPSTFSNNAPIFTPSHGAFSNNKQVQPFTPSGFNAQQQ